MSVRVQMLMKKNCKICRFCNLNSFRDGFYKCMFRQKWFESSEQVCYVKSSNTCSNYKRR